MSLENEPLSDDPEESMRLENELLKLKMQAELGARFGMAGGGEIPPEIEKQFLEQVMAFEHRAANEPMVKLREHLDNPAFAPAEGMSEGEVVAALEAALELLSGKGIQVDFLAEYPVALKYRFITQELMEEEFMPTGIPGMMTGFIYEEFHPNHRYEIERRAQEFLEAFFANTITEENAQFLMAQEIVTSDGRLIPCTEVADMVQHFHGFYKGIKDASWEFTRISVQKEDQPELTPPDDGENSLDLGLAEGMMRYIIVAPDYTEHEIKAGFIQYFQGSNGWWEMMSFSIPAFDYLNPPKQ